MESFNQSVIKHKTGLLNLAAQAVVEFATAFPVYGQIRASNEFRKQGIFSSLLMESDFPGYHR